VADRQSDAYGIGDCLSLIFKSIARSVLPPPAGLLILAALGAVLLALHHRRSGWACLPAGLGLLWLLSMPPVADTLTSLAEVCPALDPARATHAEAIVILGGIGHHSHAPEYGGEPAVKLDLLERLNYGAWLSRLTHLPILVTSSRGNSRAMREFTATGLEVTAAPVQVLDRRPEPSFRLMPTAEGMQRSNRAIYELVGERVRELLAVSHLRRQQPG
jgi:uncharacterized SAM-binding protein YcdF (DUF218 family)